MALARMEEQTSFETVWAMTSDKKILQHYITGRLTIPKTIKFEGLNSRSQNIQHAVKMVF